MGYLRSAFFRSFLIQSSWSFERMQSLGFFYSIAPAISYIHKDKGDLAEAYKRHLEYFNTNPYMAPAIIGATIKLEEEGASGEDIKGLKAALMGAYGAVGDSLFWGALRPLGAVAGVTLALYGFMWAPIVFLIIYNLPHIFMRCYGIIMGYRMGIGVVTAIKGLDIPGKVQKIRVVTLFISGILFSALLYAVKGGVKGGSDIMLFISLVLSVCGFYWGLEKGMRVEMLAVLTVALSVVFGLFL